MTIEQSNLLVKWKERVMDAVLDPLAAEKPQIKQNGEWRDVTYGDFVQADVNANHFNGISAIRFIDKIEQKNN